GRASLLATKIRQIRLALPPTDQNLIAGELCRIIDPRTGAPDALGLLHQTWMHELYMKQRVRDAEDYLGELEATTAAHDLTAHGATLGATTTERPRTKSYTPVPYAERPVAIIAQQKERCTTCYGFGHTATQCPSNPDLTRLQVFSTLLLKPGSLPKTSSGKIQRHACRLEYLANNLEGLLI
ncbi:MAG: hypothetical protein AAGA67_10265, partial [Cyanobacteria bacterium P01_F01_bin.153]